MTKAPLNHNGSEVFLRLWVYPSISIVMPDLNSTVKWLRQTRVFLTEYGAIWRREFFLPLLMMGY